MDQINRVRRRKRPRAGEHLVKRRPERIQVGSVVDGTAHPPGLLRGDVGQGPHQQTADVHSRGQTRDTGGRVEVDQRDRWSRRDHEVGRIHIAVDEAAAVNAAQGPCHGDGEVEKDVNRDRSASRPAAQVGGPRVLHRQRRPTVHFPKRDDLGYRQTGQLGQDLALVAQQPGAAQVRTVRPHRLDQRRPPEHLHSAIDHKAPAAVDRLQSCPIEIHRALGPSWIAWEFVSSLTAP